MKKIHCHTPHKSHKTKRRQNFAHFFNPYANPHMRWRVNKDTNQLVCDYLPKHYHPVGRVAWDSWRNGTRRKTMDKNGNPQYYPEHMPTGRRDRKVVAPPIRPSA
jgi:hypothetical protein